MPPFRQCTGASDRFCSVPGQPCPPDPDQPVVDVLGAAGADRELGLDLLRPIIGARDDCDIQFPRFGEDSKSLEKWERAAPLPHLKVDNEVALLKWEEEAALVLRGKEVPTRVFDLLIVKQQEMVSAAMLARKEDRLYLSLGEFVADLTAERHFDETLLESALLGLDRPSRCQTALQAFQAYETRLKRLRRLCRRHSYRSGLTPSRLRNALLATLPAAIERHLIKQGDAKLWTNSEVRQAALSYEQRVRRAESKELEPVVLAADGNKRIAPCYNCGEEHYRSKCPSPPALCTTCGMRGHITRFCKTGVFKDKLGRDRLKVTSGGKGYHIQSLHDNTRKEHLETQMAQIQKELDRLAQANLRRKAEGIEGMNLAVEEDPEAPANEVIPEPEDAQADRCEEEDELHECFTCATLKGRGLATTTAKVGDVEVPLILDSGASISLITPTDAARLGLQPESGTPRPVKGVSGSMNAYKCASTLLRIGTKDCRINFFIGDDNGLAPIMGGRDIHQNRIDLMYSQGQIGLGQGHEAVPLVLSLEEEPTIPSVPECAGSEKLRNLLEQARQVQTLPTRGQALVDPIEIPTTGDSPRRVPQRSYSPAMQVKIRAWAQRLTEEGVLEAAPEAQHFSPLVLVTKPGRKDRMCIDYRVINETIKTHGYPLPRVDDLHRHLPRFTHFSVIDLQSGFYNVPLSPASRDLTAVYVPPPVHDSPLRARDSPYGLSSHTGDRPAPVPGGRASPGIYR